MDTSHWAHLTTKPQELSVRARLERAAYLADDRNLTAKFVAGQKILG